MEKNVQTTKRSLEPSECYFGDPNMVKPKKKQLTKITGFVNKSKDSSSITNTQDAEVSRVNKKKKASNVKQEDKKQSKLQFNNTSQKPNETCDQVPAVESKKNDEIITSDNKENLTK